MGCKRSPEGEPAFLWQLLLSDRDKIAEPGFLCEQIIVARIEPALTGVVADRKLTLCGVE